MQSEHFTDFDAFASSVRGVDSVMLLQNPARRSWSIQAAEVSGIRVQVARLGSGNIAEGQSWADGTFLYLPLTDRCAYSASGTLIEKGAFMVLEPGCEFSISTKFEHDWCAIFVPTLDSTGGGALEEAPRASEKPTCRVTRPDPQLARQFGASVFELMTTAANHPQFESSIASTVTSAGLRKLGAKIAGTGYERDPHRPGRPKVPREEVMRRSHELLEERPGEHVLVAELAIAAGVSERTLRTAFTERYGIGPVRYLQLSSLHRVERALRAADPKETTVAELLLQHGEWEFGRFASRYRRLFGELPSETLRARRPIV
jgi:AraC family ethanolamine operon transcriptional activator